jgi:hypothetical protein
MEKGKPEAYRFIPQIDDARVRVECCCGCGRIYFVEESSEPIMILAQKSFHWDDGLTGMYFVLAAGESLAALEVITYDSHGRVNEHPEDSFFRKLDQSSI